jgi:hypothetical protein
MQVPQHVPKAPHVEILDHPGHGFEEVDTRAPTSKEVTGPRHASDRRISHPRAMNASQTRSREFSG